MGWQYWWLALLLGLVGAVIAIVLGGLVGSWRALLALVCYVAGLVALGELDGAKAVRAWWHYLVAAPVGAVILFQQYIFEFAWFVIWRSVVLVGLFLWRLLSMFAYAVANVGAAGYLWHSRFHLAISLLGALSLVFAVMLRAHVPASRALALNVLFASLLGFGEIVGGILLELV